MPISSRVLPLGNRLPWFSVVDLDGTTWDSSSLPADRPTLVAFLCQHSPYVAHIEANLGDLTRRLMDKGVTVLGIAPNDPRAYPSDAPEQLRDQVERAGWTFPYCLDEGQRAAKAFGASCTPEFFVYDHRRRRLVYHGEYDRSRPGNGTPVTGKDIDHAIESVLGRPFVDGDQRPSFGCSIKWTAGNEPSYLLT